MTVLRLASSPYRRREALAPYSPLFPDETVESWANRQHDVQLSCDSREERTFGELMIDLPQLPRALRQQLKQAAKPPDAWLLPDYQRTLLCARCQAEDWSQGVPAYKRRDWCVAWRTCCPKHGPYFDTDNRRAPPKWTTLLDGPSWSGQELDIIHRRPHGVLLTFELGTDRRAIHLEAALAGRQHAPWFPHGLSNASLRLIYRDLVSDLLHQFYFSREGSPECLPNPGFTRALNSNRFAINVLVEAILSVWTHTPLPEPALAPRTQLLVRAIGWGAARPPKAGANHVLFRGPSERDTALAGYAKYLRAKDYAGLAAADAEEQWGYLTLPEARLIGLECSDTVRHLAQLTRQGQFLAFDGRRGRLTENPYLPDRARLPRERDNPVVILPAWAYRLPTPPPPLPVPDALRLTFRRPPEEVALRWKAIARRWRREERKTVRFSPTRRDAAPPAENDDEYADD